MGLQIVFLLGVAAALAACKVHTFRPTLYAVGGVCVALGAQQSWAAYRLMQDLPQVGSAASARRPSPGPSTAAAATHGHSAAAAAASAPHEDLPAGRVSASTNCARALPPRLQGSLYNRWAAFIAGAATYTAGTILLSFTGDAM